MAQDYFEFKQFRVNQHRSAMKVSSDAVLFGAWCIFEGDAAVLDVGTGTGILALMCAQRSAARVCALEPDEGACEDACENFEASPWASRLEVLNTTLQDFAVSTTRRFNHIISNPPYFTAALKCPDKARAAARHNDSLPFSELVASAAALLNEGGRLSVILPVGEEANFMREASKYLNLERRYYIRTKPSGSVKRVLLTLRKGLVEAVETGSLVVGGHAAGGYSEAFVELTRDFYLKF